jgi:Ca-activated chloride channel family protein
MKILRSLGLWISLGASAQAGSWSDLWHRQDQLGQQALQAGDSKRAAELFTDPRRRAYAQIQAQQYAPAAKRLEPFADAPSQYNRGNALANSGDLQGALRAYDGALKQADLEASLRRDAQHNRDLVARQLQTQQKEQKPPPSGQPSQPKDKQNGKSEDSQSKEGSGASSSPSADENRNSTPPPPSPSPSQSASTPNKSGEDQRKAADDQAAETPQSSKERDSSSADPSQKAAAEQQANEGRQGKPPLPVSPGNARQSVSHEPAVGESSRPQTEQQLALEQWLRQIPDDPGGLLRRKFMIEHLMKQQQVQP